MLTRAWLWLGLLEAVLVVGGFFFVLLRAGWSPGDPTGDARRCTGSYLAATTMTFAGIIACQVGTAFAARTNRASLRRRSASSPTRCCSGASPSSSSSRRP